MDMLWEWLAYTLPNNYKMNLRHHSFTPASWPRNQQGNRFDSHVDFDRKKIPSISPLWGSRSQQQIGRLNVSMDHMHLALGKLSRVVIKLTTHSSIWNLQRLQLLTKQKQTGKAYIFSKRWPLTNSAIQIINPLLNYISHHQNENTNGIFSIQFDCISLFSIRI